DASIRHPAARRPARSTIRGIRGSGSGGGVGMIRDLTRGIVRENPVFVALLGLCPSLAITTHLVHAIGLGAAVVFVLVSSGLTVSLLRRFVPRRGRIPVFVAVIAVYVTVVDVLMGHYLPGLSERLGIFVPLIVVNCLILGRVDAFASRTGPGRAVLDALGSGIGFLLSLSLIASIREVLGAGTLTVFPAGEFGGRHWNGRRRAAGIRIPARARRVGGRTA
ncbi:MAG: electron transport complex subunit RsxE, partial [Spirochaetota bacterium]